MTLLFTLPAKTIYEEQNRVMAHRHTPPSRAGMIALKALVPRLKELGVQKVVASDLDEQSAKTLSRALGVPCELWNVLRRFNCGKHHGEKRDKFNKVLAQVAQNAPEVPVSGGDSRASFSKRQTIAKERLAKVPKGVLVVADPAVLNVVGAEHGKVYELTV